MLAVYRVRNSIVIKNDKQEENEEREKKNKMTKKSSETNIFDPFTIFFFSTLYTVELFAHQMFRESFRFK